MPSVFNSTDLTTTRTGNIDRTTLADRDILGVEALHVERIKLDPGVHTRAASVQAGEHFLYVIDGVGQAHVGPHAFSLQPESILWLEPGDSYSLEAGEDSLEVLLCHAPASASIPGSSSSRSPSAMRRGEA
jgi:quercetin dioxygenase-like cupin family protein